MIEPRRNSHLQSTSLVDILDRVLDKGLVVAGDIRVSLANVELLTIQVRLLVCSIDKAQEIGLDWWRRDGFLSSRESETEATRALQERIEALERQVSAQPLPSRRGRPSSSELHAPGSEKRQREPGTRNTESGARNTRKRGGRNDG